MLEASLKKKQKLIPNDTKSRTIQGVLDHFATPASTVIKRMASKLREYVDPNRRLATENLRADTKPLT
jgi:hypothetical protein